jgi:hypothetical protein
VGLKERHPLVVEQIRRRQRGFVVVELGKGHFAVGLDKCLLVDTAYALERPDLEGVLGSAIPRTFARECSRGFFLPPGLL